ncbi:MAG: hypothetical protein ACPGO3_05970 [Magnetospiraceae bacterium]
MGSNAEEITLHPNVVALESYLQSIAAPGCLAKKSDLNLPDLYKIAKYLLLTEAIDGDTRRRWYIRYYGTGMSDATRVNAQGRFVDELTHFQGFTPFVTLFDSVFEQRRMLSVGVNETIYVGGDKATGRSPVRILCYAFPLLDDDGMPRYALTFVEFDPI